MERPLCSIRAGQYNGPGVTLDVRRTLDGGTVVLVRWGGTTAIGWTFGPDGIMQSLTAQTTTPKKTLDSR